MIEWIKDQLANNEFFSGFVGAGIIGWVGFIARNVPKQIFNLCKRRWGFYFSTNSKIRDYTSILEYLTNNFAPLKEQRVHLYSEQEGNKIGAAPSLYFSWYKKRPAWLYVSVDKNQNGGWEESLSLFIFGLRQKEREDFKNEIQLLCDRNGEPKLFPPDLTEMFSSHAKSLPMINRSWDSIFLEKDLKQKIQRSLDVFLNKELQEKKKKLGLKNKLGICLYGPAGTGKTSIAYAIASQLQYSIYCLSLKTKTGKFFETWKNVKSNSIVLFDDIDCHGADLNREREKVSQFEDLKSVSIDSLLSILDGVNSKDNIICVLTTNKLEAIDPAILRSGRCDLVLEIPALSNDLARQMYEKISEEEMPENLTEATGAEIELAAFNRLQEKFSEKT